MHMVLYHLMQKAARNANVTEKRIGLLSVLQTRAKAEQLTLYTNTISFQFSLLALSCFTISTWQGSMLTWIQQ